MEIEKIQERMTALVAAAEAENRSLTTEEVETYEGLETELKAAQKTAEIRSRNAAYSMVSAPAVITARDNGDETLERAFEAYLRTGHANADITELRAQGTSDSAGGYMIPEGFRARITETQKAFGGISGIAETIETENGAPLPWPTNDDTANEGEIVAEHGTGAAGADLTFGVKTLGAYKIMSFGASDLPLRVSVELLQDAAFDVQGFVARRLGERIARKEAALFATGTGSSQPEGLMDKAGDVALATSSGNVTYAKLLDLVHSVDPAYRQNGTFVMNDSVLKTIRLMEDQNGRPLWLPEAQSGLTTMAGGTLLGYPVVVDQGVAGLGDAAKIMAFGDIRAGLVIRRVKAVTLVVNPYSRAANGEVEFTAWSRVDSLIQDSDAYAILTDFDAP